MSLSTNKQRTQYNKTSPNHNKKPMNFIYVFCPTCGGYVEVAENEINCQIFRHGAIKNGNGEKLPPHASKEECERLLDPVTGCGCPFRLVRADAEWIAVPCGYI